MKYLTWDGLKLFQKPETAATYAIDFDKEPRKLKVLVSGGKLEPPEPWEVRELEMHMRDQAPPW